MTSEAVPLGADVTLERVRPEEIPVLTRLKRAAYAPWLPVLGLEPLPYRTDYAALLVDHEAWFARDADGTEIGALVLGFPEDHLLVWSVSVAASAGGRGIGRALLAFAEAEAVRRNLTEVRLYTNVLMARNIALYQRLGYRETHRETTADGRNVVHMAKLVG